MLQHLLFSQKLKTWLLEASPSRRAEITYRVRYRFHPFWIETLDVAGLGIEPGMEAVYGSREHPDPVMSILEGAFKVAYTE